MLNQSIYLLHVSAQQYLYCALYCCMFSSSVIVDLLCTLSIKHLTEVTDLLLIASQLLTCQLSLLSSLRRDISISLWAARWRCSCSWFGCLLRSKNCYL